MSGTQSTARVRLKDQKKSTILRRRLLTRGEGDFGNTAAIVDRQRKTAQGRPRGERAGRVTAGGNISPDELTKPRKSRRQKDGGKGDNGKNRGGKLAEGLRHGNLGWGQGVDDLEQS